MDHMKSKHELLLPLGKPDPKLARGKLNTYLQVEVYYSLGGPGIMGSGSSRRGIYLSAAPIEVDGDSRGYTLFSGAKILLPGGRDPGEARVHHVIGGRP
jgi:hypothetical protein